MATPPVLTFSVNQNYFVESLGGPWNSRNFLNRFPESVYNKAIDSHLVTFLYALLGPAGAGLLREEYLLARLRIEESTVTGTDLDALYASPFSFARLAEETYTIDGSASILPFTERTKILAYDAAFRNRAQQWLAAIRAGGTVLGLALAASSGLAQPVEVVENYKALYDQFCDIPLGIPYQGSSTSLKEIILLPRNNVPKSSQQNFVLTNEPVSGFFTITLPLSAPYIVVNAQTLTAGSDLTVPNSSQFSIDGFVTLAPRPPSETPETPALGTAIYGMVKQILDNHTVTLIDPVSHAPLSLPANTKYVALVGNAQTIPIPHDATWDVVLTALQSLPVVGGGVNIHVSGGPLPDQPVTISFTGALAHAQVGQLQINTDPDPVTGVGFNSETPEMVNNVGSANIGAYVLETVVGTEADDLYVQFTPGDVQNMLYAVDVLKPATSFVTTTIGQSVTIRQPANNTFGGVNYTEVLRYVKGDIAVPWPAVDKRTNWIEAGLEHEAPAPANAFNSQYTGFHNIASTIAYVGSALGDPDYETPQNSSFSPWYLRFYDVHAGRFNQAQLALYPFLREFQDSTYQFLPNYAVSPQPDRPAITGVIGDPIGVINNSYPSTYLGLPGVQQQELQIGHFWASKEVTAGVDYLEIDLGAAQAVNYLYLEATNKPFIIDVAYDLLDQSPSRSFVAATINAGSTTTLSYVAGATSPWTPVVISFDNSLGQIIFTRFIRIGFTRNPSGPPFQLPGVPPVLIPYSIEVRNLRVGRNVASRGVATTPSRATQPGSPSTAFAEVYGGDTYGGFAY